MAEEKGFLAWVKGLFGASSAPTTPKGEVIYTAQRPPNFKFNAGTHPQETNEYSTAPTKPAIKTYVLVGDDSKMEDAAYSDRGDVIIIRAKPKQSIEDAVRGIEIPANILLAAHGDKDGTFIWNKNQQLPYSRLFAALPREGIASVTLNSCYGGTASAEGFLKVSPAGILVQSLTGAHTLGWSTHTLDFIGETHSESNPATLLVKALDNFDPKVFNELVRRYNRETGKREDSNPENALPHIIGMGGKPPLRIHLDLEANEINKRIVTVTHVAAWIKSIARVQAAFETQHYVLDSKNPSIVVSQDLGPEAEKKLDDDIARIAGIMRRGEKLGGKTSIERAENKRIAYALTAAFLDESGTLQYWKEQQIAQVPKTGKEAGQDKKQLVTASEQSSGIANEMEVFAKKLGVQDIDRKGKLSNQEIQAIQGALGVASDGIIGKKALAAYEHALQEGHLPAPATPAQGQTKAASQKQQG